MSAFSVERRGGGGRVTLYTPDATVTKSSKADGWGGAGMRRRAATGWTG